MADHPIEVTLLTTNVNLVNIQVITLSFLHHIDASHQKTHEDTNHKLTFSSILREGTGTFFSNLRDASRKFETKASGRPPY
jgi:hypothetical protein